MKKPLVSAIAAIGKNRELGHNNKLLWQIPDDLKRFKALTMSHPVVMGMKTFQSILEYLGKPLPGRMNIVINHELVANQDSKFPNLIMVTTVEEAIAQGKVLDTDEIFICGGAYTYQTAFPYIERLHLTLIDAEAPADVFFPKYENEFTKKLSEESHEWNGIKYSFVDLDRA